jgi:hypothetical protein
MTFLIIAGIAIFFVIFYVLSQWYEVANLNRAYSEVTEFIEKFSIKESSERLSVYSTLEEVIGDTYKRDPEMPESVKNFFSKVFDGLLLSSKQSVKMVGTKLLQKEFSFRLNQLKDGRISTPDFFGSLLEFSLFIENEHPSFSDWDTDELSDPWTRNRDMLYKKIKQYMSKEASRDSLEETLIILSRLQERRLGSQCVKCTEHTIHILENAWKKSLSQWIAQESAQAIKSTDPEEKYVLIYQSLTRSYPSFAEHIVDEARQQLVEDANMYFEVHCIKDVVRLDVAELVVYMESLQNLKTRETLLDADKITHAYQEARMEYHKKLYEETCTKPVTLKMLDDLLPVCTTSPYKERLEERIKLFKIYTETVQEVPTEGELRDLTKDSSLIVVYSQPENIEKSGTTDHLVAASA